MRRVQYVSQKVVKDSDIRGLTPREQDNFIREVAQAMERDLAEQVRYARPLGPVQFKVSGPFRDPIQGLVHCHTIWADFDLDTLPTESPFRANVIQANRREEGPGLRPIEGPQVTHQED